MRSSVISAISSLEWHASDPHRGPEVPAHDLPARSGDVSPGSQAVLHRGHHYRTTIDGSLLEQAGLMSRDVVADSHGQTAPWTNTSLQEEVVR
ncbi:MAG: hypothetical protein ACYCZN_15870 [Candidatus Dormibacteria bacterium]